MFSPTVYWPRPVFAEKPACIAFKIKQKQAHLLHFIIVVPGLTVIAVIWKRAKSLKQRTLKSRRLMWKSLILRSSYLLFSIIRQPILSLRVLTRFVSTKLPHLHRSTCKTSPFSVNLLNISAHYNTECCSLKRWLHSYKVVNGCRW